MTRTFAALLLLFFIPFISTAQPRCVTRNDFSFYRNMCDPLTMSFHTNSKGYNTIRWDIGEGGPITGTPDATHTYTKPGIYKITMIQNYGSCIDTVTKLVLVDLQPDDQLVKTPDTLHCTGGPLQLKATSSLNFCWSPSTYLDNPASSNPLISKPHNLTYHYTAETRGDNLITNSDFSLGNTGFTSDYLYSPSNGVPEGLYNVGTDIKAWHPNMEACNDHTTGSSNMMMVNGATVADVTVWRQTVSVQPNTNYEFSTWLEHITSTGLNPAQLQFAINGNDVGYIFEANTVSCIWDRFYTSWNSGSSTTAILSIVNKNIIRSGNDFALDDLYFGPVNVKTDSVKVTVGSLDSLVVSPPVSICPAKSTQLKASGGDSYTWEPAGSLSNPNIPNPVASPNATTTYKVTVTNNICKTVTTLSTTVTVLPTPAIKATKTNDIDCNNTQSQLSASGGAQYNWTPATGLNDANSASPVATPLNSTKYVLKGTTSAGCINYDSVVVYVHPPDTANYLMPSAFTPNNDGLNDCYGMKYWGTVLELDFSIYNRLGNRVFYSRQPGACWNGKYKGDEQAPGTYVYMIRAKTNCAGTITRKGTFVLIR